MKNNKFGCFGSDFGFHNQNQILRLESMRQKKRVQDAQTQLTTNTVQMAMQHPLLVICIVAKIPHGSFEWYLVAFHLFIILSTYTKLVISFLLDAD